MISNNVSLKPLWVPSRTFVEQSNFKKFQNWLFVKKGLYFRDYHDLWDWSVTDLEDFWECIWQFSEIKSHNPYWDVLVSPKNDFSNAQWFTGATVNYAESIFRHKNANRPALLYQSNRGALHELSWKELEKQVAAVAAYLRALGIGVGDTIAVILHSGPQAVVTFLAANTVGAVWSLCRPEMTTSVVAAQFQPLQPKVLFTTDGYFENEGYVDKSTEIKQLISQLPTLQKVVLSPSFLNTLLIQADTWQEVLKTPFKSLEFTPVSFASPLWILYPDAHTNKAITHNTGGCLLEHLKIFSIHQNIKAGERFFWYHTPIYFSIAAMLVGAIPLLTECKTNKPNGVWELIERAKVNHFGVSTDFFMACTQEACTLPELKLKFNHLISLTSLHSTVPLEGLNWIYQNFKKEVWVNSFIYHSEINSSLAGSCATLPIYAGENQYPALGCKINGFDAKGYRFNEAQSIPDFLQPMPSLARAVP